MALDKSANEIGKVFKGDIQIGKRYKGDIYLYSAAPDYLYQNGKVDGEYLKTMTGSNSWNDNGYGYGGSLEGKFLLNSDGAMYLSAGASSGYGNTYSCENKAESNYMDLSGADSLTFTGYITASGAYFYWQWGYIDLIDAAGKEALLVSVASSTVDSNPETLYETIDHKVTISNLDIDLTQVKLRLRYGYRHHAPWSNWYGGSGNMAISAITVDS